MKGDDELRVCDDCIDYDEELNYTYNGKPFTGIGYDDVPGFGLSEITYVDGLQDGPARDWFPSGKLKSETMYRSNVSHGYNREFREDGSLSVEEFYEHGVLVRSVTFGAGGDIIGNYEISDDSPSYNNLKRLRAQFE